MTKEINIMALATITSRVDAIDKADFDFFVMKLE